MSSKASSPVLETPNILYRPAAIDETAIIPDQGKVGDSSLDATFIVSTERLSTRGNSLGGSSFLRLQ